MKGYEISTNKVERKKHTNLKYTSATCHEQIKKAFNGQKGSPLATSSLTSIDDSAYSSLKKDSGIFVSLCLTAAGFSMD